MENGNVLIYVFIQIKKKPEKFNPFCKWSTDIKNGIKCERKVCCFLHLGKVKCESFGHGVCKRVEKTMEKM